MKEKKRFSTVWVHLRSYHSRQESRVTLALVYPRARSFLSFVFEFVEWNASKAVPCVSGSRSSSCQKSTKLSVGSQSFNNLIQLKLIQISRITIYIYFQFQDNLIHNWKPSWYPSCHRDDHSLHEQFTYKYTFFLPCQIDQFLHSTNSPAIPFSFRVYSAI